MSNYSFKCFFMGWEVPLFVKQNKLFLKPIGLSEKWIVTKLKKAVFLHSSKIDVLKIDVRTILYIMLTKQAQLKGRVFRSFWLFHAVFTRRLIHHQEWTVQLNNNVNLVTFASLLLNTKLLFWQALYTVNPIIILFYLLLWCCCCRCSL